MKKHTILCVDDDSDDLQLLHETLKGTQENFDVIEAHNGRQALELLQRSKTEGTPPRLIILDINMPVLNGKETLSIIKNDEVLRDIPVVVFTTSGSETDRRFCDFYGVEMITKPPTFQNFKAVVEKLLRVCMVNL
jgi:CheY-like chemotaxis protein